jgi:hypothetical protein
MATMALPIGQIGNVIVHAEAARAETQRVAVASEYGQATFITVIGVLAKSLALRWTLSHLAKEQTKILKVLVERDFSNVTPGNLLDMASRIDDLVAKERGLLRETDRFDVTVRVWWDASLKLLADQTEHFDSISESLHAAADDHATALMAVAVSRFSTIHDQVMR